jgi:hypothetical protein
MGGKRDKRKKKGEKAAKPKQQPEQHEEEDFDTILQEFEQSQLNKAASDVLTRRVNASLSVNPLNPSELIFFGGEYFNGKTVAMYNDLFFYNVDKLEFRKICNTIGPNPRSSHQVAITPAGLLFLWGGEFISPNESSFFHYKDFWMMDLKTLQWEEIQSTIRPSPRSGHRMVVWKHFLVLFGGFYETSKETR